MKTLLHKDVGDTIELPARTLYVLDEADVVTHGLGGRDIPTMTGPGFFLGLSATGIRNSTLAQRERLVKNLGIHCTSANFSDITKIDQTVKEIPSFTEFLFQAKNCGKVVFLDKDDLATHRRLCEQNCLTTFVDKGDYELINFI